MAGDEEYVKYAVFHDRYSEYAVGVAVVLVDNFRCKTVRGPVQFTLRGSTADAEIMVPPPPPHPQQSHLFLFLPSCPSLKVHSCLLFFLLIDHSSSSFTVLPCNKVLGSELFLLVDHSRAPLVCFLFLLIDHSMSLSSVPLFAYRSLNAPFICSPL